MIDEIIIGINKLIISVFFNLFSVKTQKSGEILRTNNTRDDITTNDHSLCLYCL